MWSAKQKHECASRELTMRIRIYAKYVAQGKMSRETAGREIALMSAIAEDYRKLAAEAEATPLPLFGSEPMGL